MNVYGLIAAISVPLLGAISLVLVQYLKSRKEPDPAQVRLKWLADYEQQLHDYARQMTDDMKASYERQRQCEDDKARLQHELRATRRELETARRRIEHLESRHDR